MPIPCVFGAGRRVFFVVNGNDRAEGQQPASVLICGFCNPGVDLHRQGLVYAVSLIDSTTLDTIQIPAPLPRMGVSLGVQSNNSLK